MDGLGRGTITIAELDGARAPRLAYPVDPGDRAREIRKAVGFMSAMLAVIAAIAALAFGATQLITWLKNDPPAAAPSVTITARCGAPEAGEQLVLTVIVDTRGQQTHHCRRAKGRTL